MSTPAGTPLEEKLRGYFRRIARVASDGEMTDARKIEEMARDAVLGERLIDANKTGKGKKR